MSEVRINKFNSSHDETIDLESNIWLKYTKEKVLKETSEVITYLVTHKQNNCKYVIKEIKNQVVCKNIKNTSKIRKKLKSPYIIYYDDILISKDKVYLIYEFIEGINLKTFINSFDLTYRDFYIITESVAKALIYLKKNSITHGDIKPSNIIYNQLKQRIVLTDFDYLIYENKVDFKYIGTIEYSSPEQIQNNIYNSESDIYSLGLTLYNLVEKKMPYIVNEKGIRDKISGNYTLTYNNANNLENSECVKAIINGMLEHSPWSRIEAEDIENILEPISNNPFKGCIIEVPNKNDIKMPLLAYSVALEQDNVSIPNIIFDENSKQKENIKSDEINRQKENINIKVNKSDVDIVDSKSLAGYHSLLLKEYKSLIHKSDVIFWLWISSLIFAFIIIIVGVILVILNRDIEAFFTLLLEGFVFGIYKLFEINSKHYQDLIEGKLKHLEKLDKYEYVISKVDTLSDQSNRDEKLNDIIDSIRDNKF